MQRKTAQVGHVKHSSRALGRLMMLVAELTGKKPPPRTKRTHPSQATIAQTPSEGSAPPHTV